MDDSNKWWIRFAPKRWDTLPFQKTCARWTSSHRLVLFEFVNNANCLDLNLVIGPGKQEDKQAAFDPVKALNISGAVNTRLKPDGWSPIVRRHVLNNLDYIEEDWDGIQEKIKSFWKKYVDNELEQICQTVIKTSNSKFQTTDTQKP